MSELCTLAWRDLQPNQDGGQITVLEKGSKTRSVQLPASVWQLVSGLRSEDAGPDNPVFASRKGKGFLQPNAVLRIVGAAAERGRHRGSRVAHWLRHAHASHALDRGAPIHLVQGTLGHAGITTTGRYLHARPTDSSSRYLPL